MDSSKFGRGMPFTFANLSDIDLLVTDGNVSKDDLKRLRESGVKVSR